MIKKTISSLIITSAVILSSSCADGLKSIFPETPATIATPAPIAKLPLNPVAKRMINPTTGQTIKDHYISPFPPHNPIVAKGFKSGQLAGDPSTIQNNPNTGKPDNSTMKTFKLP